MAREDKAPRFSGAADGVITLLDSIAKFLLSIGGFVGVVGIGLMIFSFMNSANASPDQIKAAAQNLEYFRQAGLFGTMAAGIAAAWLFWGEEIVGPIFLIFGFALFLSPLALAPANGNSSEYQNQILENIKICGAPAILLGFLMILGDIAIRIKTRAKQGAKAEQMKYGKGIKEERDTRNVFMGKCWQLPYCRKFVRERCPIYHAKRTCWKERVGCMCEESVIKNAMDGKTISTDMVAAAKFIPQNNKLTANQKAERCRQCVIYNEHQKHKYKLALPVTALSIAGIYIGLREPLASAIKSALVSTDKVIKDVSMTGQGGEMIGATKGVAQTTSIDGVIPYHEIILFVGAMVLLAYAIKVLEYLFFRAKV